MSAASGHGVEVGSDVGEAHLRAGLEALRHEEYERAAMLLEAAASALPEDPRPPTFLSGAYLALGRPDDATAAVERALALDPDGFGPHLKAGELAMRFGDLERAESEFLIALRAAPGGSPDLEVARRWLAIVRERLRRSISHGAFLPSLSDPLRRWRRALPRGVPVRRSRTAEPVAGLPIRPILEEDHR